MWVMDILKKYFVYDSSIFPVKTPLYGLASAPREIYHPSSHDITKNVAFTLYSSNRSNNGLVVSIILLLY